MPFSPLYLLFLIFLTSFFLFFIQIGLLTIVFDKLGLSPSVGLLLLLGSLFGSGINLPLFSVRAELPPQDLLPPRWGALWRVTPLRVEPRTVIAINLGGCLIPVGLSLHLLTQHPLNSVDVILAVAIVSLVSYLFSRPIPGIGIGMPVFVAPLTAAVVSLLLDATHSAPLAYIGGTLGVLIGADLLRLEAIPRLGARIASIGGAGTFDGIFLTGIVAALLA